MLLGGGGDVVQQRDDIGIVGGRSRLGGSLLLLHLSKGNLGKLGGLLEAWIPSAHGSPCRSTRRGPHVPAVASKFRGFVEVVVNARGDVGVPGRVANFAQLRGKIGRGSHKHEVIAVSNAASDDKNIAPRDPDAMLEGEVLERGKLRLCLGSKHL